MQKTVNAAAIIGFVLLAVAFMLEKSACLGLPGWAVPVLTTLQLGLTALAQSPLVKGEAKPTFGPPAQ